MKYLLDTNVVVDYLRNQRGVVEQLRSFVDDGLAISIITLAELYEGVWRASDSARAEQVLQDFLGEVTILNLDEDASKIFGRERAKLRSSGTLFGDLDLLIASTALQHDLALLTNDRAFERIERLTVLQSSR